MDKKLVKIAKGIRKELLEESDYVVPDLGGFCAIFTARFVRKVRKANWYYNHQHCFPVVDGIVYDGTARQFSYRFPDVVVDDLSTLQKKYRTEEYWNVRKKGKGVRSLVKHLKKNEWSDSQIPLNNGNLRKITKECGPF